MRRFLLKDERILANAKASEGGTLYATNKRVIRYEKGFFGEKMKSLDYVHIIEVSYKSESHVWLVAVGIAVLIFGFWINFAMWPPNIPLLSIGLILAGPCLVLFGIASYRAWYQIKAVGMAEAELKEWRTTDVGVDAKTFANFIQHQISKELQTEDTYERIRNHLQNNRKNAYTRVGLMVEVFKYKKEELDAAFKDWSKEALSQYTRIRRALAKLEEEELIESIKEGKNLIYWWKDQ